MTDFSPEDQAKVDHLVSLANDTLDDMLETSEAEDCDPIWTAYSLFLSLVHFLTISGWTPEQLQADVARQTARNGSTLH